MSSADQSDHLNRAQAIVEAVIARRRRGEIVSDQQVLQQHPELLGTLEGLLHKAAVVDIVRSSAQNQAQPLEQLLDRLEADPELADDSPPDLEEPSGPSIFKDPSLFAAPSPKVETQRITIEEAGAASASVLDAPAFGSAGFDAQGTPVGESETWGEEPVEGLGSGGSTASLGEGIDCGETAPFRPTERPPMAMLYVLDDGLDDGETVRLRRTEFSIGRSVGDLTVPHDSLMSSRHARIVRRQEEGLWKWSLKDDGSTNGVFVQARRVRLRDGDQLILASRMIRFAQQEEACWLEEIRAEGPGQRLTLSGGDYWIGRDASVCTDFLADEPTLDPRFARLLFGDDGRWTLWNNQSLNGLWVRVDEIELMSGSRFQLGEQRFLFRLP